jgi:Putative metal-binding motif/Secretion system C-terminal sorting domain/HYR domain
MKTLFPLFKASLCVLVMAFCLPPGQVNAQCGATGVGPQSRGGATISTQTALNAFLVSGNKPTVLTSSLTLVGNSVSDPITDLCNLENLTKITGTLTIRGFTNALNPGDLDQLANLTEITTNLVVGGSAANKNTSFTSVSLPSIQTIGGLVDLSFNTMATTIDISGLSSNSVTSVIIESDSLATSVSCGGDFTVDGTSLIVRNNPMLSSIDINVVSVATSVTLSNNDGGNLTITSTLGSIGTDLAIQNCADLKSVTFSNLTSIGGPIDATGGNLTISANGSNVTNIHFEALVTIDGNITMSNSVTPNNDVSNQAALSFDVLTEVDGTINLVRAAASINMPFLTTVAGSFLIRNNAALANLDGLANLVTVGTTIANESFSITTNPALAGCCILTPCHSLESIDGNLVSPYTGDLSISGNTATCNSVATADNVAPVYTCPTLTGNVALDNGGLFTPEDAIDVSTATDNCAAFADLAVIFTTTEFDCANLGAQTFDLTIDDCNGNTKTCTYSITIVDDLGPQLSTLDINGDPIDCSSLSPVAVNTNGGASCSYDVPDMTAAVLVLYDDACTAVLGINQTPDSLISSSAGTLTFVLTDDEGNVNTVPCELTVVVTDDDAPEALCQDFTVYLDAMGEASITTADVNDGSSDNCTVAPDLDLALDITSFDCTNVGTPVEVTLTVTDEEDLPGICTADVTVLDEIAPALTGTPYSQTGTLSGCMPTQTAAETMFNAVNALVGYSDNCSGILTAIWVSTVLTGTDCAWDVEHTYKVVDAELNVLASQTYSEDGLDETAPHLGFAPYTQVGTLSGCKPEQIAAEAMFSSISALEGYRDYCSTTLTAVWVSTAVTGTDCAWNVEHTYKVVDACSNELAGQKYDEDGEDDTAPALTITAYAQTGTLSGCKPTQMAAEAMFSSVNALVGYTDNCTGTITAVWVSTAVTGTDCAWNVEHTYKVVDACSNELAGQKYDEDGEDDTAPALMTTAYAQTGTLSGCKPTQMAAEAMFSSANALVGYTDNCTGTITAVWVSTAVTGTDCAWNVEHTYKVVDACSNELAGQKYDEDGKDDTAPALTTTAYAQTGTLSGCKPTQMAAEAMFSSANALVGYTDNCTGTITAVWVSTAVTGTDCAWNVEHTYKVVDACSNELAGQKYDEDGKDDTAPALTTTAYAQTGTLSGCKPTQMAAEAMFSSANALVGYTDNCTGTITAVWVLTAVTGTDCAWNVEHTYKVVDACSNELAGQKYDEDGKDDTAPSWTTSANALDATLQCSDAAGIAAAQAAVPVGTDNCDATVTAAKTAGMFVAGATCSQAGTYTNTFTLTDGCSNVSTVYTQVITIIDNTVPVWTTVANALDATLQCSDAAGIAAAQAALPVGTDNCDVSVTAAKTAGMFVAGATCAQAGTYTNTFTLTDDCGNVSEIYTQVITIIDNTAPVFASSSAPAGLDIVGFACGSTHNLVVGSGCNVEKSVAIPSWTDNCSTPVLTRSVTNGASISNQVTFINVTFNLGSSVLSFMATDACGNTSTCSITVVATDVTNPTISSCPTAVTGNNDLNTCSKLVNLSTPTYGDNCNTVTATHAATGATTLSGTGFLSSQAFNVGATSVVYTVTDGTGLTATCGFSVTITDTQKPIAVCATGLTVALDAMGAGSLATNAAAGASTDNCSVTSAISAATSVSCSNLAGPNTVVLTVSDAAGNTNSATCTFTVTDGIAPAAICATITPITLSAAGTASLAANAAAGMLSTDNCTVASETSPLVNLTCANIGANSVTLTATDSKGNSATTACSYTVSAQPAPIVACYETATYNNTTCVWDVTGTQPVAPTVACYETATFNGTTCTYDVTGTQPAAPTVACYETATFNGATCTYDVTGTQPVAPTVACYETATFNTTSCVWDVTGTQSVAPAVACYETATFNTGTCAWVVTGSQPAMPTLACYETALFNGTTCMWVVSGTQPVAPAVACYQTATFNSGTCAWVVTGTQPAMPTLACYENATFNGTTCMWDVTGTMPVAPTVACYETATFNSTSCTYDVTGTLANAPLWYQDTDNDTYGNSSVSQNACTQPVGYAAVGGDCDDAQNTIYPNAPELCDGIDQNCDGQIENANTCVAPSITATASVNPATKKATMTWTAGCYQKYRVQYRATTPTSAPWTLVIVPLPTTTYTTPALMPGTYQWAVRGHCYASTLWSTLANGNNFTIPAAALMAAPGTDVNFTDVIAYPNPVQDVLHVDVLLHEANSVVIRLTDALGRNVYTTEVDAEGAFKHHINMEDLQNGIYTLMIYPNGLAPVAKQVILTR